ncbi:E3 ubiquitin-protein transferase Katazuke [Rhodnius prolixus]|uniref:E3 ubiquitin-protein transferase MAEA n=1 Tax=Rhodnius neglectus TaxID=72488 RepID=A0A0N7Z9A5_9HEMI
MADIKALEHPTLKVPYEILNKKFRAAQKQLDREVSHVQAAALEVEKGLLTEKCGAEEINKLLGGMVDKLQVLKRKAEESICEELQAGYVCKKRLEHLKEHTTGGQAWCRQRLDRMLVDYFLRQGYYNAASSLTSHSQLSHLTNIDVFLVSREVEKSLMNRETGKCLAWCHDNRSKLRKLHSTMEFNLRVQEFVQLIKTEKRLSAVKHARKYFSNFEEDQIAAIQHCMALLAFPTNTELSPYKELLEDDRWGRLVEQFRQENYKLYQLASQSVFTVALQAGLSALKTPQCYGSSEGRNKSCPVCDERLNKLAELLPSAHCSHSRLICNISGVPLDEHNQPMMLPNNRVYGKQSLLQMAAENNGQVICPRTKEVFPYSSTDKVFVM